ncbi:MAG: CoA transferase [Syntrophomonadaceae bacterium]|nr:CoA transferase [Syntrophomonadaceae bacterium]
MGGPLAGITVLDLTKILAGPFCTMQLADFGANVIKVEPLGIGDEARSIGPHVYGESAYFVSINRNKKSIALNIKHPRGKKLFQDMVRKTDILVENFRPGTMERLGLSYKDLLAINPSLIYATCSGFGQTGPYAPRPAYDATVQAMGGLMYVTGEKGGSPTRVGISISDLTAGLYLAIGVLLALVHRQKTGEGQFVDVAMLDCQVALMENHISRFFVVGKTPEPIGNRYASFAPFGCFETKDGFITIAASNDKLWSILCKTIGRKDLIKDPRFQTNTDRLSNNTQISILLEEALKLKTTKEWVQIFNEVGVPNGPVNTVADLANDPQILAREMIVPLEQPHLGKTRVSGVPVKLAKTPGKIKSHAPLLGEHTVQVLKELLGLSDAEIKQLKQEWVIEEVNV